jgi:hypothetical protein
LAKEARRLGDATRARSVALLQRAAATFRFGLPTRH